MARIGIIINPYAKRNVKRHPRLLAKLQKIGGDLVDAQVTHSLEDIDRVGKSFYDQQVQIIGICGGDGSLCVTLTKLMKIYGDRPLPTIMPLKGGTMNMVCASTGIKKRPEKVVREMVRLLRARRQIPFVERDTMLVEGRIGFIFGAGMAANFLDVYYDCPRTGPIKAVEVVIRAIFSTMINGKFARRFWRPLIGKLSIDMADGTTHIFPYENFWAILSMTIANLGIGAAPMYRAFERPRFMHIIAANLKPLSIILRIHKIFLGRPWNNKRVLDEITQRWSISSQKPMLYTLDGELYNAESNETSIDIGPRFKIISLG